MKSAVEWLVNELGLDCTTDHQDEIQEALQMEKEQTIKSILDNRNITSKITYLDASEYYDKTFNQQ
jgi:hypothetical protein